MPVICPAKCIHFITDPMTFFNWFTKKSDSTAAVRSPGDVQKANHSHGASPSALTPSLSPTPSTPSFPLRPPADPTSRSEERKAKRHIRREQLYLTIRQAMTRSGVLSASFKFKVLSLDQHGDQFLVMMDVHPSLGLKEEKLLQSEALVMQIAKAQFGILVTAVYWRVDTQAGLDKANPASEASTPNAIAVCAVTATAPTAMARKLAASRFEPLDDGEMIAFRRAVAAAAARMAPPESDSVKTFAAPATALTAATAATVVTPKSSAKSHSGLHSHTVLTGFADTETPELDRLAKIAKLAELAELSALSTTQYGDLN